MSEHDETKPGDLVPEHVKQNYAELHEQGRSWESMAEQAENMNDRTLAAYLRGEAQEGNRDQAPKERTAVPKATQTTKAGGK